MEQVELTKEQKEEIYRALVKWEIAKKDRWTFLKYFVRTFDEHDPALPNKQFPIRAYARFIERADRELKILFMKKSRQIRLTWEMAALMLHDAMFSFNYRGFDQSKKQDDANGILERQVFIYSQLDPNLPGLPKAKMTGDTIGTKTELEFTEKHSFLRAIPQGGDIVRSYTCSAIFADEIHHQPEAQAGYEAAKPTITGGGRWRGIGTANGHSFGWAVRENRDPITHKVIGQNRLDSRKIPVTLYPKYEGRADDKVAVETHRRMVEKFFLDMPQEEFDAIPIEVLAANMPGVDYWQNHRGIHCLFVHYTADPEKDPKTEAGRAWYKEEEEGSTESAMKRELEGDEDLNEGFRVVENWNPAVFVRQFDYDSNLPLLISADFGTILCGAAIAQLWPVPDSQLFQLRFLDEIVIRRGDTVQLATELQKRILDEYKRSWLNRNLRGFCDPNGDQERETTSDKSMNTSIKIMEAHGFSVDSRKFGVPDSTQTLEAVFKKKLPNGEPMVLFHPQCTYLISCMSGCNYPIGKRNLGHYEKDGEFDHGMDMVRYMTANNFDAKDLTGKERGAIYKRTPLREKYTGRVVGYHRELTDYGRAMRRARENAA